MRDREAIGTQRHSGIDGMRLLLCFAVAVLHALPRADAGTPPSWAVLAATLCRGAVPFFFVAAGYFAKTPSRAAGWNGIARPLARLLPPFFAWLLIYAAIHYFRTGTLTHGSIRGLINGGAIGAFHLWFLPALAVALVLVSATLVVLGEAATGLLCLLAAALNLASGAYEGVTHLHFAAFGRASMGPLLVFVGMTIRRRGVRIGAVAAGAILVAAWGLSLGEELLVAAGTGAPLVSHDTVAATYLMGPALLLLALTVPNGPVIDRLARPGRLALGIYASHLVFLTPLKGWLGYADPAIVLADALVSIVAATLLSAASSRFRATRILVR